MTSRPRARKARLALLAIVVASVAGLVSPTGNANAVTPTATNCGGTTLYKSSGSTWTCSFDDELNGTTLDLTKWAVQLTSLGGFTTGTPWARVCYINSSSVIAETGGFLYLTVRKVSPAVRCGRFSSAYIGGSISGIGKFAQTYGRFEVRAMFPSSTIRGLHSALWMWPVNPTKYGAEPKSGEIDIAESYSNRAGFAVPDIHYQPKVKDPNVTNYNCAITIGHFHTYTLVWGVGTMSIAIDGKSCVVDTWNPAAPLISPQPFDQPFFMALTAGLGMGADSYESVTQLPATTSIDYVRIWK